MPRLICAVRSASSRLTISSEVVVSFLGLMDAMQPAQRVLQWLAFLRIRALDAVQLLLVQVVHTGSSWRPTAGAPARAEGCSRCSEPLSCCFLFLFKFHSPNAIFRSSSSSFVVTSIFPYVHSSTFSPCTIFHVKFLHSHGNENTSPFGVPYSPLLTTAIDTNSPYFSAKTYGFSSNKPIVNVVASRIGCACR